MRKFLSLIKKSIYYVKNFGIFSFLKKSKAYLKDRVLRKNQNISYNEFIKRDEKFNTGAIKKEIESFKYKPLISVIIPTYNTPLKFLNEAVKSVQTQFYQNWEIIIYDDASSNESTISFLKKIKDPKIKVFFSKKNRHISKNTNLAIQKSNGEYLAFLDHDDTLSKNALYEIVKILQKTKNIDFFYSDEDKLTQASKRHSPFFKPDFSYDLLLSCMYITHLRVIRKEVLKKVGIHNSEYDGAQDWDLALRFYEKNAKFYHIPKILYHWREGKDSTASSFSFAKDYAYSAQRKLLEAHLKRVKENALVSEGKWRGSWRIKRKIEDNPKVEIIIPFKDKVDYLRKCIESILKKSSYKNYEILLIDNNSMETETFKYLETLSNIKNIRMVKYKKRFNYSLINNFGAKITKSDYLLFLNSDIEVITKDWIECLLENSQRKNIGAVGGLLLYKDGTVQHAGIILGLGGVAAHSHRGFDGFSNGHGGFLTVQRNYSAVTAACMMIERQKFEKVKGFDPKLEIAYNDVDLCLRLEREGFNTVYTPYVKLYHFESKTRKKTKGENIHDTNMFIRKYKQLLLKGDPYYNPNLTLSKEDFTIRKI